MKCWWTRRNAVIFTEINSFMDWNARMNSARLWTILTHCTTRIESTILSSMKCSERLPFFTISFSWTSMACYQGATFLIACSVWVIKQWNNWNNYYFQLQLKKLVGCVTNLKITIKKGALWKIEMNLLWCPCWGLQIQTQQLKMFDERTVIAAYLQDICVGLFWIFQFILPV